MSTIDDTIRRIVREEILAALSARPRAAKAARLSAPDPPIADFVATLAPGERVQAADLYARWRTWASAKGLPCATMTATAFGRLAVRCHGLVRSGVGRRWDTRMMGPPCPHCGAAANTVCAYGCDGAF